jgi:hypothetical protein
LARSLSVEVFFSVTSFLMVAHLAFSILALSDSIYTLAFSTPTISANASASFFFTSASAYLTITSYSIIATYSAVSYNLIRPVSYLSFDFSS